jgi:hypothetical protein
MDERDEDNLVVEEEDLGPVEEMIRPYLGRTMDEAVIAVSKERGLTPEKAMRSIYKLAKIGRVRLVDPSPPEGFLNYFASQYSLWFWVLSAFLGASVSSIYLMPQVYPLVYVRYLCGALLVLYVPGFTLIEALYPKADELERLERFGLSVGLSIALVPLVGLVLNYTPWGIRLDPSLMSLILLVLVLGFIGVYRKYGYWIMTPR